MHWRTEYILSVIGLSVHLLYLLNKRRDAEIEALREYQKQGNKMYGIFARSCLCSLYICINIWVYL
jgi:hypothetical protein